jgi:hypothetical protein
LIRSPQATVRDVFEFDALVEDVISQDDFGKDRAHGLCDRSDASR